MFTKSPKINSSRTDFSNYIGGFDVYNARIFDLIKEYDDQRILYKITTKSYRPDLIAKDVYGSSDYLPFLLIASASGLSYYEKGNTISIFPKNVIDAIIARLG